MFGNFINKKLTWTYLKIALKESVLQVMATDAYSYDCLDNRAFALVVAFIRFHYEFQ